MTDKGKIKHQQSQKNYTKTNNNENSMPHNAPEKGKQ
jgi:hypothetical protein